MFVVVWQYRVRQGSEAEFEAGYCADGTWAEFFRGGEGYLGTELLRDDDYYVTIDRWSSRDDFDTFIASNRDAYLAIDKQFDVLTVDETKIGEFETVGGTEPV